MNLIKGDCLIELKKLPDKSIDFFYLDLPFGQTACSWDVKLDHKALWIELRRLAKNDRTPFFFSCTTKFGFELYNSAPKGWFRWDLVWKKNRAAGFLNAYKLPMRKHEMIYCFAKKTPDYDVSSHKEYTEHTENRTKPKCLIYGDVSNKTHKLYKDPLPTSDITPPTDEHELVYCFAKKSPEYDVSSHKEYTTSINNSKNHKYIQEAIGERVKDFTSKQFKDPLPTSDITPSSWCEYTLDSKINHRTAKPVKLMEFLLKYWTKEGATVCDPTAGSGSMGIAAKNMNRKFIGIEKDNEIFQLMKDRIENHIVPESKSETE
jgi:hypothetical protein